MTGNGTRLVGTLPDNQKSGHEDVSTIFEKDNRFFLSDHGKTYQMPDKVFAIVEPDVQNDLSTKMRKFLKKYCSEYFKQVDR